MYFFQMCITLDWMESELYGDFLDYPESFYTIPTFSGLSRQYLATLVALHFTPVSESVSQ